MVSWSYGQQTNTLPASGNVGIGTTTPQAKLQVRGATRIDSTLYVDDSVSFKGSASVGGSLVVGDDIFVNDGTLHLKSLGDTSLHTKGILMINEDGKVVNGGKLQSIIYNFPTLPSEQCPQDINGNILYAPPIWQNEDHGMFLIDQNCHYTPRLGVGVKPQAKLQVRLSNGENLTPLIVEKYKNGNLYKLLQLDNSGTLHAREVKVDLTTWPDYVFKEDYKLMPLEKLERFINKNGHLPDVPTAEKVKNNSNKIRNKTTLETMIKMIYLSF